MYLINVKLKLTKQHSSIQMWYFQCLFLHPQITYIETSAKDPPMNVDKAFHELVRVIR